MGCYAQMKKEQHWEAMAGDVRIMKLAVPAQPPCGTPRWKPFFKLWAARGFGWKMTAPLDRGSGEEWDGKVETSWTI